MKVLKFVVRSPCALDMAKPMQGRDESYEEHDHELVSELEEEKGRLELKLFRKESMEDKQVLGVELQHTEDALNGGNRKLLASSDRLQCAP